MNPIDIRSNRVLSIALIVVGGFLLLVSLLTGQVPNMFLGVLIALLGVLMLVNPVLRIESNEVQQRNPLGMVFKRYPVSSPADLRLDGSTLYHVPSNKKIAWLPGYYINGSDVEALRSQISNRTN